MEAVNRGLLALYDSGMEFLYCMMDLNLFNKPHPFPVIDLDTSLGLCLHMCGRWAGQPSGSASNEKTKADTAKEKLALDHYKSSESVLGLFS